MMINPMLSLIKNIQIAVMLIPVESNKLFLVQFSLNSDHEAEVLATHFAFIQTNSKFRR